LQPEAARNMLGAAALTVSGQDLRLVWSADRARTERIHRQDVTPHASRCFPVTHDGAAKTIASRVTITLASPSTGDR
jgi:hypothetical protein